MSSPETKRNGGSPRPALPLRQTDPVKRGTMRSETDLQQDLEDILGNWGVFKTIEEVKPFARALAQDRMGAEVALTPEIQKRFMALAVRVRETVHSFLPLDDIVGIIRATVEWMKERIKTGDATTNDEAGVQRFEILARRDQEKRLADLEGQRDKGYVSAQVFDARRHELEIRGEVLERSLRCPP